MAGDKLQGEKMARDSLHTPSEYAADPRSDRNPWLLAHRNQRRVRRVHCVQPSPVRFRTMILETSSLLIEHTPGGCSAAATYDPSACHGFDSASCPVQTERTTQES